MTASTPAWQTHSLIFSWPGVFTVWHHNLCICLTHVTE